MKISNKLIIISLCVFVFSAWLFLSALTEKPVSDTNKEKNVSDNKYSAQTLETENNISKKTEKKVSSPEYVIKLENGKICAYMNITGQKPLLWNSMDVPLTLSQDDINALNQGIYTNSFEELCLFFESYAS